MLADGSSAAIPLTMSKHQDYSTLLGGAAKGLHAVRCIYFDDLADLRPEKAWEIALTLLGQCEAEPTKVDYMGKEVGSRRVKSTTFERRLQADPSLKLDSLAVMSAAADAISQVWEAPTYVGFEFRPGQAALFFYSDSLPNHSLADWACSDFLQSIEYAAAYAFDYALPFSPTAYFWGLGYSPNRRVGESTRADDDKLVYWRDNLNLGLRPSGGCVRDLYQQNLLTDAHLCRLVEALPLAEWIRRGDRGILEPVGGRWLWSLESKVIPRCRVALNKAGLLLSGRPLGAG
jgi:hypothetical protein